MGSASAKTLARELNARRVYPDRTYRTRNSDFIINWGNGAIPNWYNERVKVWNNPEAVNRAGNKLLTFKALEGNCPIPNFTTNKDDTTEWEKVVVRHELRGSAGSGIEVVRQGEELPDAPMYVEFIKKNAEYRVHVFAGEVIDITQKRRIRDFDEESRVPYIRNHANGWVFSRNNIDYREDIQEVALDSVRALGLDFGGVDVIIGRDDNPYILEVNTAVGMEGSTVEKYVNKIKELRGF